MSKEIVELMKRMIEDGNLSQEIAEKYCPELKESEDERIRKDCIKYLLDWEYKLCDLDKDRMKIEKCVTWLEKQGNDAKLSGSIYIYVPVKTVNDKWRVEEHNLYDILNCCSIEEIKSYLRCGFVDEFNAQTHCNKLNYNTQFEKQGEKPKEHNVCDSCDQQGACVEPCCVKLVEKQSEQKPIDKVEPKFKIGDWVTIKE